MKDYGTVSYGKDIATVESVQKALRRGDAVKEHIKPVVKKAVPIQYIQEGFRYYSNRMCIKIKAKKGTGSTSWYYTFDVPIPLRVWNALFANGYSVWWERSYNCVIGSAGNGNTIVPSVESGMVVGVTGRKLKDTTYASSNTTMWICTYVTGRSFNAIQKTNGQIYFLDLTRESFDTQSCNFTVSEGNVICIKKVPIRASGFRNFRALTFPHKCSYWGRFKRRPRSGSATAIQYYSRKWTIPRKKVWIDSLLYFYKEKYTKAFTVRIYPVAKGKTSIFYVERRIRRGIHK